MKASNRNHWKLSALGASVLAASTIAGFSSISTVTADPEQQVAPTTPVAPRGGRGTGFSGRPASGGDNHHLQGMDVNPPAVELAPAQADTDQTQANEKVAGADYYDGQYYGDPVSAGRWGTMQVVAVIENGELVDVLIADYPRSTYESDIITRNALPTLISEAITAQDADVDFVSRATDSSRAFIQSLDSALLDAAIGVDL